MIVPSGWNIEDVESLIVKSLNEIHATGPTSGEVLETLSYIKAFYPEVLQPYESTLIYELGLFYKTTTPQSMFELVYETYKQAIIDQTSKRYTPIQYREAKDIRDYSVYSFSAPTSSGKSYVFLDLLKDATNDVVVVLPSRALIAEYLKKLRDNLPPDVLVLQFVDNINIVHTTRRIYVITPERAEELLDKYTGLNIGMILFDEAQIIEEKDRGLRFDSLVRRISKKMPNVKIVFAHPFIANPEVQIERNGLQERNYKADVYTQQNVGKIYIYKDTQNQYYYFSPYTEDRAVRAEDVIAQTLLRNGTVLIYIAKTQLYKPNFREDYKTYIEMCPEVTQPDALKMIKELREYIGGSFTGQDKSVILELIKRGIVIHHGSMPLRARYMIERFVNAGYARICFATSTLIQGINMPFDVVLISNFRFRGTDNQKILDFKNLIGRAGRTSSIENRFDYGYVVVHENKRERVKDNLKADATLSSDTLINAPIESVEEDLKDIVEAVQNDTFDTSLQITESQKSRLVQRNVFADIEQLLDKLFKEGKLLSGNTYQQSTSATKSEIKQLFQNIYVKHLRRADITPSEKSVLSTAVSIMLWRVQGRSFKEIIALRKRYVFKVNEREKIEKQYKLHAITKAERNQRISKLGLKYTPIAVQLPQSGLVAQKLFPTEESYSYDLLMYDTYDYLDKVIGFCLSAPISAALRMYYAAKQDERAERLANYIRFGTDDRTEIMLQRYGFVLDDMDWLMPCIDEASEERILFNLRIFGLDEKRYELIERYVNNR